MSSSLRALTFSITLSVITFILLSFISTSVVFGQTPFSTCYTNNTEPGCNNTYCETLVCEVDSHCCGTQWDASCANKAIEICPGNCLTTQGHDTGCSNNACETIVCEAESSCCDADWSETCVAEAINSCGFQDLELPGTELCWPIVAKNGNVAVNCLGPDLLNPVDVNDPETNTPPVVDAGDDQNVTLSAQPVNLSGVVVDDGKPTSGSLSILWELTSGDSKNISIANPNSESTDITLSESGVYVFQLTADDGELTSSDTVQITANEAPADLIVDSVNVSDATPNTDQAFTINATARNQGGSVSSSSTTLRYYRSTNSFISVSDTQIGTDDVTALAAGGSSPESISVSIAAAGTYWIGACIDSVSGETPTNNQCSSGVQVTVSAATPADLIVDSVNVSDATPNTDQAFTINATANNQGGSVSSSSTTLRYYRSTNSTISTGDTQIGIDPVSTLAAGGSSPESISVSIAAAGTYWIGACIDSVSGETPTNNQCSSGVQVTVSAP